MLAIIASTKLLICKFGEIRGTSRGICIIGNLRFLELKVRIFVDEC